MKAKKETNRTKQRGGKQMTANEIKLGNHFIVSGFPMYVEAIFRDTVYLDFEGNEGDVWEENIKELVPIPLTEEILLKAGFEFRNGVFAKDGLRLMNIANKYFRANFPIKVDVQYLHQLQNLFFALMGEEIKIEL